MAGDPLSEEMDVSVPDDWIFDSLENEEPKPVVGEVTSAEEVVVATSSATPSTSAAPKPAVDPAAVRLPRPGISAAGPKRRIVERNLRALIIVARKRINTLKTQISSLNKRLEGSQAVKCPSCDHQFSTGIKNQLRPEYVRVMKGRLAVELQFADYTKLTDWLLLTGLHEDNAGAPVLQVAEPKVLTLEMVGSTLKIPVNSCETAISNASTESSSSVTSGKTVNDKVSEAPKRSPVKPLRQSNQRTDERSGQAKREEPRKAEHRPIVNKDRHATNFTKMKENRLLGTKNLKERSESCITNTTIGGRKEDLLCGAKIRRRMNEGQAVDKMVGGLIDNRLADKMSEERMEDHLADKTREGHPVDKTIGKVIEGRLANQMTTGTREDRLVVTREAKSAVVMSAEGPMNAPPRNLP
ncbi:hypothetical protein QR680_011327 [Steinernema hermaphroditum]|uniref:Uncharacterized protein n=2 Tax=Steinernema hermaphroditum TaxID=289476 RepID=A0AA39MD55_9BILA|nr:hypothetical protein QR680_011327 [Steinernema hermaphroditum]